VGILCYFVTFYTCLKTESNDLYIFRKESTRIETEWVKPTTKGMFGNKKKMTLFVVKRLCVQLVVDKIKLF
jgi:hypothetical protein